MCFTYAGILRVENVWNTCHGFPYGCYPTNQYGFCIKFTDIHTEMENPFNFHMESIRHGCLG